MGPHRSDRIWAWLTTALATLGLCLTLLTLVTREWIEAIFGVDPDGGNGSLEWLILLVLVALTAIFAGLAGWRWRRLATN